ncbi:MAG: hypothetical protein ACK4VI_07170 [Alphaproteobacteria bacterium]
MALNYTSFRKHHSVVPHNVTASLMIADDLAPQRLMAHEALHDIFALYDAFENGEQGANTRFSPDLARYALARNDHTTLRPAANEDKAYMRRMLERSLLPIPVRALCAREEQMRMVIELIAEDTALQDALAKAPDFKLAMVSGSQSTSAFPHFFRDIDAVKRDLERKNTLKEFAQKQGINAVWEYDSVIPYMHWLDGDFEHVRKMLEAEAEETKRFGFTWKSIQKLSVHAHDAFNKPFGADYFKSAYESSMMALEAGAECVKTSSGLAALPPLHDFVAKDDGAYASKVLPMLMAVRDFNAKTGEARWPKFSGGSLNIADAAAVFALSEALCGSEIAQKTVIGAGTGFRDNLVRFVYEHEGVQSGVKSHDFAPYKFDAAGVSPFRRGWIGAANRGKTEAHALPAPDEVSSVVPEIQ